VSLIGLLFGGKQDLREAGWERGRLNGSKVISGEKMWDG
jgi:hypothetical protein